ncbi:hypothetical protein FA13DRAFT_1658324 [Coprinellus micaceus]|uniref:Uncharacterized protein n=1 Tax=Coprinellus micaceus TaxID=71717 RepID=A0A4Y7TRR9_COPMI|nr:hypothetical protein FA13DRAFT_1658324 [Coprinellus micaceus]
MLWSTLVIALALVQRSLPQDNPAATEWCDDGQTGICWYRYDAEDLSAGWGFIFPRDSPPGRNMNEFIGIMSAPTAVGWLGASLGGSMRSNPLIVGWLNGTAAAISIRRTEAYSQPSPLEGPIVTILGGSGIASSTGRQRIIYRCENCISWTGGSGGINLNGNSTFGFAAHGSIRPNEPANADSQVYIHTIAGLFDLDVESAKQLDYWDILEGLQARPMLDGVLPTPTTSAIPSATGTLFCPGAPAPSYTMNVASGWKATPVLGGLASPRGVTMDEEGHLLLLERGKGVTAHTLDVNGCVTNTTLLIDDDSLNHGLDISPSGNKLFASSSDIVWSWNYDPTALTITNQTTLVTGMHNPGHVTRTLWVSRKHPDLLLVSVGSNGNIDEPAFQADSGRAQIRVFNLTTIPAGGVQYNSRGSISGQVMGYGIRNDVGIAEDRNGTIHSVENSMDNAYRTYNGEQRDIHSDNPAEKVYKLGNPAKPSGLFGGYPYCYTVWRGDVFPDGPREPGDWFVQDPNTNQYTDRWCDENAVKPTVLLPPHTAPLDMKFGNHTNDTNVYIPLHGSWNREPPQGYKVVVVPGNFSATGEWFPAGNLTESRDKTWDLLANVNENQCESGCFRPVALTFAHGGDWIYVTSDASGEVFLLKKDAGTPWDPTNSTTPTSGTGGSGTGTGGASPTSTRGPHSGPVKCRLKKSQGALSLRAR